ncbi:MAG: SpoIVB peptidase [Oscillospiraceae bacterium]|nr:SpoIVB peptidase [Oscillospiraceae bacterium]
MRRIIKFVTGLFLVVSVLLCTVIGFYYVNLPDKYYLSDKTFKICTLFDIDIGVGNSDVKPVYASSDSAVVPKDVSVKTTNQADLKLLGLFPIKTVDAEIIERPLLIPCGTPFGIKIITGGAIVTEFGEVDGEDGYSSPARDGGIKIGDIIIKVNDMEITQNGDISEAVQLNPEIAQIIHIRDGKSLETNIVPVKSNKDDSLKIGMWVRDSSAGIGTLTFYNPSDGTFGGLGHAVCDVDTGQKLPLLSGDAVSVNISGVTKGFSGSPGELNGSFLSRVPIGEIRCNTEAGIFGVMESPPTIEGAIPMSYKQEVEIGSAKIIATVDGSSPKEYDVIIEKIDYSDKNKVKNMVVKVTDKELLSKAGGIVQGMSGSPIVQNGRLAGAVTHVFVSDPTRGYAIFAENMYRESLEIVEPFAIVEKEYEEEYEDAA